MPSPNHHTVHSALTPTALVITSHLLRHDNPNLARAIQQALKAIPSTPSTESTVAAEVELNRQLLSRLHAQTIGEILAALTALGQQALHDHQRHPERIALLHELLDEWVALAEWILQRNESPPAQWH